MSIAIGVVHLSVGYVGSFIPAAKDQCVLISTSSTLLENAVDRLCMRSNLPTYPEKKVKNPEMMGRLCIFDSLPLLRS